LIDSIWNLYKVRRVQHQILACTNLKTNPD
jgi:hypothetical protein